MAVRWHWEGFLRLKGAGGGDGSITGSSPYIVFHNHDVYGVPNDFREAYLLTLQRAES